MKRVLIVCPGRGTYTRSELGCLTDPGRPDPGNVRQRLVAAADCWRDQLGRERLSELDRRRRFDARHLAGENAAALIFTASAADASSLSPEIDVVAVCGNSLGWYTALHVSGVFGFEEGLRLVDILAGLHRGGGAGGQVIVPVMDAAWRPDAAALRQVAETLAEIRRSGLEAWPSIHLGGYEVLAGEDEAIRLLLRRLPKSRVGERDYPFQLLGHAAFHSPLMAESSRHACDQLRDLPWRAPRISLVDGRGFVFRPLITKAEELRRYTLETQMLETFDFTTSLRVGLREFGPEALVLLGPGDSLGGAIGQVLVQEGWSGLRTKIEFQNRQRSDRPLLYSLGRPQDFAALSSA